ncbi:hypothetical protein BJV78DRAFT_291744 [Lactifluus subvellereus]|nr:hypothetical protein BJV78DRAFT_291744 [Lactifluus subvellereus]
MLAKIITPSPAAVALSNNARIVSLSIAAYDYLLTIPWEYRLYTSSDGGSLGLILFILIRYSSVILMIVSNVGFFNHHFSPQSCGRYYLVIPAFKIIQVMVSQAILGIRTYNIARRNVWVGRTLLSTYCIVVVLQWVTDTVNQTPVMADGNCMISNSRPDFFASFWTFYLVSMLYDCLVLSISTVYLLRMRAARSSAASQLARILLYDGLGYFIVVTAMNLINLLFHRGALSSIQTAGASLGNAITWIMSQRILIHPREARTEQKAQPLMPPVFPPSMRLSGETMGERTVNRACSPGSRDDLVNVNMQSNGCLQVRVERSVVMDNKPEDNKDIERKSDRDPGNTV